MAFQIRRAHRFFSSPQDLLALRTSNRESRGKVPCTFPGLRLKQEYGPKHFLHNCGSVEDLS